MAVTSAMLAVALGQTAPLPGSILDEQWTMWIGDAEMLIQSKCTELGIDFDGLDQAKTDYVVREAVVAHIKRPDDATQVQIAVDDGSTSRTYRSGKGRVTIADEWWGFLGLTQASGAFAFDMAPQFYRHLPWCSSMLGATFCSCGVDIAQTPIYEE